MQDIHSLGGGGSGGGILFGGGGGGGGDRRLRPHGVNHQALKCPRCESLNTKFCYYNNYNLSQARHFCKSCRRYWTKGGVLRNVPVGGGCRKTKRSSSKSKAAPPEAATASKSSRSQNSSSDSSNLAAPPAGGTDGSSNSPSTWMLPPPQNPNPAYDPALVMDDQSSGSVMLPEIGTFSSLIDSSEEPLPIGFDIADIPPPYRFQQQQRSQDQVLVEEHSWLQHGAAKLPDLGSEFLDLTNQIEFKSGNAELDWSSCKGGVDQGLFDITGAAAAVDQSYWSQTQWTNNNVDQDHQLDFLS